MDCEAASALVMGILKGETTVAEAARKHGLTVADVEHWKDTFWLAAENALVTAADETFQPGPSCTPTPTRSSPDVCVCQSPSPILSVPGSASEAVLAVNPVAPHG